MNLYYANAEYCDWTNCFILKTEPHENTAGPWFYPFSPMREMTERGETKFVGNSVKILN
jgi:hypothetical protein